MKKGIWMLSAIALFTLTPSLLGTVAVAAPVQGQVHTGSLAALPTEVPMASVWKGAALSSFDAILPDKRAWLPVRVSEDGVFVGNVPAQKPIVKPAEIILYDAKTKHTETVASLQVGWQVGDADLNEQWLVWTETYWDESGLKDQKLHVYNRLTKKDQVIATGSDLPYQNPIWAPKVQGDDIVWSQAIEQPGDMGLTYAVMKRNLVNGMQTTVTNQGAAPVISKHDISWIGPDQETNKPAIYSSRHGKSQEILSGVPIRCSMYRSAHG